jgi:HD superfamily phosphodiesterase
VLLWPADKPEETVEQAAAVWRRRCSRLQVRTIPGDVMTCHTRHVADLAAAIAAALRPTDTAR